MKLGNLNFEPIENRLNLVAEPVKKSITNSKLKDVLVAEINPNLADTTAFCEEYGIALNISANCVIVEAKRAEQTWYAACMVLATTRADVNGIVRKHLDARKISFAPMDRAITLTGMEYGGITPLGLPANWPILVDRAVDSATHVVIGSGIRSSKLLVPGKFLASLPNAAVLDLVKVLD